MASLLRITTASDSTSMGLDEAPLIDESTGMIDGFWSRLIKMIPMEALAVYPVGKAVSPEKWWPVWPLVCAVIIVLSRVAFTKGPRGGPQWGNLCITLVSFFTWVYLSGDWIVFLRPDDSKRFLAFWFFLVWVPAASFFYRGDDIRQNA
jgi:hypothetical protein